MRQKPTTIAIAAGYVATCAVFAVIAAGRPEPASVVTQVAGFGHAFAAGVAAAFALGSLRRRTYARTTWLLLGLAAACWSAGSIEWTRYGMSHNGVMPYATWVDVIFLATPALTTAGLLLHPGVWTAVRRARALVDAVVAALSLLAVGWILILEDLYHQASGTPLEQVIALAYPTSDIVTCTVTVFVLARCAGKLRTAVSLVAASVVSFAVADLAFAVTSQSGVWTFAHPSAIGYLASFGLLAAAATRAAPSRDEQIRNSPFATVVLPYGPVVMAVAAIGWHEVKHGSGDSLATWLGLAVLTLTLVRQIVVMRENDGLHHALENRVARRTAELADSEERFRSLVTHSTDGIAIMTPAGDVRYASPSMTSISGLAADQLLGRNLFDVWGETPEAVRFRAACTDALARGGKPVVVDYEVRARRLETTITSRVDDPAVGGLVLNTRDVTDRWRLERDLAHQAFHDTLTGLPNRRLFQDRLGHALARSRRPQQLVVLLLDLDGFKAVNDAMGHTRGDELLALVAARLRDALRPGDTVARLGGDEFAVLIEDVASDDAAVATADRLTMALDAPFEVAGREVVVRASIGIAHMTDSATVEDLLRNADLAMYVAKANRNTPHAVYHQAMHESATRRLDLLADLRHAVSRGELVLHYQPVLDIATRELRSVEALVRWQHPQRGLVPPMEFIPLAEESGLIADIGDWVLRTACAQAAAWRRELPADAPFAVAINISGQQLALRGFVDGVRTVMAAAGVRPDDVVLEMTESTLMAESEASLETLRGLRGLGVRLAIDDFGTGYSSLSYLRQFCVDILKIDKAFIDGIDQGPEESAVARAVLRLGQTMHLTTIAEGIETESQRRALVGLGCPLGQGYLFSRPVPASEISELVARTAGAADATPWVRAVI